MTRRHTSPRIAGLRGSIGGPFCCPVQSSTTTRRTAAYVLLSGRRESLSGSEATRWHPHRVLDKVYVRSHSTFGSQPLDVGALAEACLFYDKAELVLGRGSLRQLLDTYRADDVVEFVTGGYVQAHLLDQDAAVLTESTNAPGERHRPVTISVGGESVEAQVVGQFRESTGRSGLGRRRAMKFLEAVNLLRIGQDWQDQMLAAFRDRALIQRAVSLSAKHAVMESSVGEVEVRDFNETADGYFTLELGGNWSAVRAAYAATHGGETLNQGHLLVYLVEMLTDLQLASRLQGDISTSELGSALMQLKCREIEAAMSRNRVLVSDFQVHTLHGRDVRAAINSGTRSLGDLMKLLDRSKNFRHWLREQAVDTDLISAYISESTATTWAAALPAKSLRLAILLGIGPLIAGPAGLVAGAVLSAADMFLLDRVAAGWRPNQFVDRALDPFVRT